MTAAPFSALMRECLGSALVPFRFCPAHLFLANRPILYVVRELTQPLVVHHAK